METLLIAAICIAATGILAVTRLPARCRANRTNTGLLAARLGLGALGLAALAAGVYSMIGGYLIYQMAGQRWVPTLAMGGTGFILVALGLSFTYCAIDRFWNRHEGGRDETSLRRSNRWQYALGWILIADIAFWIAWFSLESFMGV